MQKEKTIMSQTQFIGQKEILTFKEACLYLGVSTSWLYKLSHLKKISYFKPNGKLIYFKRSDLTAWLLRNRVSSEEELERRALDYVDSGTATKD